jgi:hypothetical protein
MARRGTVKRYSVEQEDFIARLYGGVRSKSSGASKTDQGDVRCPGRLIECKYTGNPGKPMKSTPKILKEFEKITQEAWSEGKEPALALRYFAPESVLANHEGWVDLIVRRVADDSEREHEIGCLEAELAQ